MRPTRPCCFCGYAYKGRGILADHGFAEHNLEQHEAVCLEQQAKRARAEAKRQDRRSRAYRRRLERLSSGTAPMPGQLGFPFDGVPKEVK